MRRGVENFDRARTPHTKEHGALAHVSVADLQPERVGLVVGGATVEDEEDGALGVGGWVGGWVGGYLR